MKNYRNVASLTYNSIKKNSNIVDFQAEENLSITLTASPATYRPGDIITYTITIINSSDVSYSGVDVTDNLGQYTINGVFSVNPLKYIDGTRRYYRNGQPGPTPDFFFANWEIKFMDLNILPHETATLVYQASLTEYAPYEIINGVQSPIINTATLSDKGKLITDEPEATSIITGVPFSDLSLTKWLTPNPIVQNQEVTYSFLFQNYGNVPVETGAVISDSFSHPITIENVTFNNTQWIENTNYTYTVLNRKFESKGNSITVPAATYQRGTSQEIITIPGTSTLTISGIVK